VCACARIVPPPTTNYLKVGIARMREVCSSGGSERNAHIRMQGSTPQCPLQGAGTNDPYCVSAL